MDAQNRSISELEQALRDASCRFKLACTALEREHKGGEWEEYVAAHAEVLGAERTLAAAKGDEYAIPVDFPVEWDTGAPLPCLLQSDQRTFVVFFLHECDPHWDGTYVTVGAPADPAPHAIGVVEFDRCLASKMGAASDEMQYGHTLHGKGLDPYTAQEVINSRWLAEVEAINRVHRWYDGDFAQTLHHYVLWFHDSTFECLAQSFEVETYDQSFQEVLVMICDRLPG